METMVRLTTLEMDFLQSFEVGVPLLLQALHRLPHLLSWLDIKL